MALTNEEKRILRAYFISELANEIDKSSHGSISSEKRYDMARETVDRLDFTDSYQMHKNMKGYADMLLETYQEA